MGKRCDWADSGNQALRDYHDQEWGFPTTDERQTYELMILEMMQAGLSWQTILNKRAAFRKAFKNFDVNQVAKFGQSEYEGLLVNPGIIRNRLKIRAAINNAQLLVSWHQRGESLNRYLWKMVNNQPVIGHYDSLKDVPATSPLSIKISKDLKKKGFRFIGPTIVYSWLQALGILNDHLESCPSYSQAITAAESLDFDS